MLDRHYIPMVGPETLYIFIDVFGDLLVELVVVSGLVRSDHEGQVSLLDELVVVDLLLEGQDEQILWDFFVDAL